MSRPSRFRRAELGERTRWDMEAKVEGQGKFSPAQAAEMVRALLEDRFSTEGPP